MNETVDYSKLINDALNGDNAAFKSLYGASVKTAYHTASLLLNNHNDVEDVLQNSYVKAYEKLPELKNPESFEGWIKTIVENESKNYIKKEKRFYAPIVFFKNKSDENSEEWKQPVPQEYMEREELRKKVSDIIDKLSPEVRTCIILFHYEEKSLNEISEFLDIPIGTVKSRLHNGRKQIEKEFNKLRKKDPTLYGVGAIPVIFAFLSYQTKNIVIPATISEGVITSVATATSATSVTSAAGGAAASTAVATSSTAASGVATTAAASIAVKLTAVAVAGSVAVGGTVAVKTHIENKSVNNTTSHYSSTLLPETCTTSETTELLSETELTTLITTLLSSETKKSETSQTKTTSHASTSAIKTSTTVREITTETTSEPVSTAVETTSKPAASKTTTTSKPSTTLPSTTKETTTEKKTTAEKITTTSRSTTETEKATTAQPENNYGTSGGVITEYTGTDSDVSIPSTIGSETVTAIGAGAFAGNTDIESVRLPSSVTQIGQEAFADCTSLASVSFSSSLELIGIGAFYGCTSLTSVTIPDGTKTISDEAFAQCGSLSTITIPSSVTSISDDAFDGCDSLTIRCEEGSAAHDFAITNNINFSLM